MDSKRIVNVIFVSGSQDESVKIASNVLGAVDEGFEFRTETDKMIIKGYIRSPSGEGNSRSPIGPVDVMVCKITLGSEHTDYLMNYVKMRRGIPTKLLFTDLTFDDEVAKQLGVEWHALDKLEQPETKERIISASQQLEDSLRDAFNTFDANGNGFIEPKEIVEISKMLEHEIDEQEAQRIVNTLSKDGKIDFKGFKKWWVFGKSDFNMFRMIIKSETASNKLMKNASLEWSKALEKYSQVEDAPVNRKSSFLFGNEEPIDQKIGISLESNEGVAWQSMTDGMPPHYVNNAVTLAIEVNLTDPSKGEMLTSFVNQMTHYLTMIPEISQVLSMGMEISTRQVDNKVFIELVSGGMIEEMVSSATLNFTEGVKFNHVGTGSAFSSLSFADLLSADVEEIIKKLSYFRVASEGEYTSLNFLLPAVETGIASMPPHEQEKFQGPEGQAILAGIKALIGMLDGIKYMTLKVGFDNERAFNIINGAVPDEMKEKVTEMREELLQQAEAMRDTIDSVIGPFKDVIKTVNFDKIGIILNSGLMKFQLKANLHLDGFTEVLNEIAL